MTKAEMEKEVETLKKKLISVLEQSDPEIAITTTSATLGALIGASSCCEDHAWKNLAVFERLIRETFVEGLEIAKKRNFQCR